MRTFPSRPQFLQPVAIETCGCGFTGKSLSFVTRNDVRKCVRCHGSKEVKRGSKVGQIVGKSGSIPMTNRKKNRATIVEL